MFRKLASNLIRILPLSALFTSFTLYQNPFRMHQQKSLQQSHQVFTNFWKGNNRLKYVKDIVNYVENESVPGRSVIFFELRGDPFIDNQVVKIAQQFINSYSNKISQDYEFIFLQSVQQQSEFEQNYLILYGLSGQKVINIDCYLNKNRNKSYLKINSKPLMKRLVQSLNGYKEIGLQNISQELDQINLDDNYTALFTTSKQNYQTHQAKLSLKHFLDKHDVKSRFVNRYITKDQQTASILGINAKSQQSYPIYLLAPNDNNLKKQFRQKAKIYKINDKQFTNIDVTHINPEDAFVFPPIQPKLSPSQLVVNVYINKNKDYTQIQQKLYEQLSKPQYNNYHKSLYYSNEVEESAIFLEMNDYSKLTLQAFQTNTSMSKQTRKQILSHTFEYQFKLKNNEDIDGQKLQQWLKQCKEGKVDQYFKSQKINQVWAQQITGQQYKAIRDLPTDKVIYHYSHHCHGCKKFGGKYEQFAKDKAVNHPNINFYRINNDRNKTEGVRNFNSTPVFVFYKKGYTNPFVYKMPIFTESLFESFLKITSEIKLMSASQFTDHLETHKSNEKLVNQLYLQIAGQKT